MSESVTLKSRSGLEVRGQAEVQRFSDSEKMSKALPIGIGGTILGLCTIVIPGVHFISTWLIPLISIYVAYYFYNRKGSLGDVSFTCPECGAESVSEGGAWEDPMWIRCSSCTKPLSVVLDTPIG